MSAGGQTDGREAQTCVRLYVDWWMLDKREREENGDCSRHLEIYLLCQESMVWTYVRMSTLGCA